MPELLPLQPELPEDIVLGAVTVPSSSLLQAVKLNPNATKFNKISPYLRNRIDTIIPTPTVQIVFFSLKLASLSTILPLFVNRDKWKPTK